MSEEVKEDASASEVASPPLHLTFDTKTTMHKNNTSSTNATTMDATAGTISELQETDMFEDLHSLEEKYYHEGHALGTADGAKAGRIEGRVFGMEKGFAKFVELGTLQGRTAIWASRSQPRPESKDADSLDCLPPLPASERTTKQLRALYTLIEPGTFSTLNEAEGVEDVDSRLKRAAMKVKLMEKLVGEISSSSISDTMTTKAGASHENGGEIEDFTHRFRQP